MLLFKPTVLLLLIVFCLSCACTAKKPDAVISDNNASECNEAWIYAPDIYILDLTAGAEVSLHPTVQDFPLFCSKEDAANALIQAVHTQQLPAGQWALYRVHGKFSDLAEIFQGKALLAHDSALSDWSRIETKQ